MPPKRIAKRRSPPEDALSKSKKVKGKLVLASFLGMGGLLEPTESGIRLLPPRHLRLRAKLERPLYLIEFYPLGILKAQRFV